MFGVRCVQNTLVSDLEKVQNKINLAGMELPTPTDNDVVGVSGGDVYNPLSTFVRSELRMCRASAREFFVRKSADVSTGCKRDVAADFADWMLENTGYVVAVVQTFSDVMQAVLCPYP